AKSTHAAATASANSSSTTEAIWRAPGIRVRILHARPLLTHEAGEVLGGATEIERRTLAVRVGGILGKAVRASGALGVLGRKRPERIIGLLGIGGDWVIQSAPVVLGKVLPGEHGVVDAVQRRWSEGLQLLVGQVVGIVEHEGIIRDSRDANSRSGTGD